GVCGGRGATLLNAARRTKKAHDNLVRNTRLAARTRAEATFSSESSSSVRRSRPHSISLRKGAYKMRTKKSESKAAKPKGEPTSQKQSGIVRYRARDYANPMRRVRLTENADSTTSTEPTSKKQSGIVRYSARDSADTTTSTKAFAGALSQDAFVNLVGPEIPISDPRLELMVSVLTNTKP